MSENSLNCAGKTFFWVDSLPIATAVCDLASLEIVAYNALFGELTRLNKENEYKITDFLDVEKSSYLVKNGVVKLTTALNERKALLMDSNTIDLNGVSYLICTFVDVFSVSVEGLKLGIDMLDSDKIDPMTGIYNREYGYILLNEVIHQSGDNVSTICYLDINELKKVNEKFGRAVGDEYIMNVVSVLKTATRQSDMFARLGDDEFLLIFPKCRFEIVETIMDTVMNKLEVINKTSDKGYETSISFGIVELLPGKFENADMAISVATIITQEMKSAGGNKH